MRFHPELSMDGLSQHGQTSSDRSNSIDDTECEIGQVGGTQTLKTQQPNKFIKETKSMNFLTSVSANHNVQVTSRNFEVIKFHFFTIYFFRLRGHFHKPVIFVVVVVLF